MAEHEKLQMVTTPSEDSKRVRMGVSTSYFGCISESSDTQVMTRKTTHVVYQKKSSEFGVNSVQ